MAGLKKFIESRGFEIFIIGVIVCNAILMGLQTSAPLTAYTGNLFYILDTICLGIFIVELIFKLVVYHLKFFRSGWNIFDLIIVCTSVFSEISFLSLFRVFRIFRVFRSLKVLKTLKSFRALRMISSLEKLQVIIIAIGRSIPSISWTAVLLLLIYYIFAIMGVTLFGSTFEAWFGSIGKSMYTLFQVMTLESWSMGIARPVMEVFPWAYIYFVPFVLIASFIVMNVVVGIVVNAISDVAAMNAQNAKNEKAKEGFIEQDEYALKEQEDHDVLRRELQKLREQLDQVERLINK